MSRRVVILSVDLLMAAVVLMAVFLSLPSKTGVFIPIVLFSIIGFGVQLLPMILSSTKEVVFDMTLYILNGVYLFFQLAFNVFAILLFELNVIFVWTVCVTMFLLYIVGLMLLKSMATAEIERNKKEQQKHFYFQKISAILEESMKASTSSELRETIRMVFDNVKYSDPNSSEKLIEIETEILGRVEALLEQVQCNKLLEAKENCSILENKIQERNLMCKMYKC